MALVVSHASAAALLMGTGTAGTPLDQNGGLPGLDNVLGFEFKVGAQSLKATSLGFWDRNQDGLPAKMLIGLWDTTGNSLVASATINSGTSGRLYGDFRYVDLSTPIILESGKTYTLGFRKGANTNGLVEWINNGAPPISPDISIVRGGMRTNPFYFLPGSSLAQFYPQYEVRDFSLQRPDIYLGYTNAFIGANLQYTLLPEPTMMAAIGGVLATTIRRRHRSS